MPGMKSGMMSKGLSTYNAQQLQGFFAHTAERPIDQMAQAFGAAHHLPDMGVIEAFDPHPVQALKASLIDLHG